MYLLLLLLLLSRHERPMGHLCVQDIHAHVLYSDKRRKKLEQTITLTLLQSYSDLIKVHQAQGLDLRTRSCMPVYSVHTSPTCGRSLEC